MSKLNLSSIVHAVVSSDASDQFRQRELFGELIRESERARAYGQVEIDFLLEVSIELSRFLADGKSPSLDDVQRLLTRVLVNAECKAHRHVEGLVKEEALPPPPPVAEAPEPAVGEATQGVTAAFAEEGEEPPAPLPSVTEEFEANPAQIETSEASQPPSAPVPVKALAFKGNPGSSLRIVNAEPAPLDTPDLRCVKLGEVMEHLGLADHEIIERAIEEQGESKQRIGQVISRLAQLRPIELRAALDLHAKVRDYAKDRYAADPGSEVRLPFRQWHETLLGEVLIAADAISMDQLKDALKEQRATGHLLGEILVQRRMCDSRTVLEGIRLQEKLRSEIRPPAANQE